jgi:DNA-binding transcriptional regulator YdaS (Cro superfamily)
MDGSKNPGLERAIEAAGGITALARSLGLTSHAVVHSWRLNRVPADHCPVIEATTGVRCEELRPDVRWDVLRNADCDCRQSTDTNSQQATAQGAQ